MEKLPVKLLTELLTPDEIISAEKVRRTHEVGFCPVGISLWDESDIVRYKNYSEFHYTPRAYFAVKVWETARNNLLKRREFAGALDIEWYPVAASFRSVRFVNGDPEKFIAAMFAEMKRAADSHTEEICFGCFDVPAPSESPDYPRRYYIMPQKLMTEKRGYAMKDELTSLQNTPAGTFSWCDIENVFVILKPIQLAFIAGDDMNYCKPLDKEFINACANFDLDKVKELVAKGANIHAATHDGDTAMGNMIVNYYGTEENDLASRKKFIELAQYLLSLGYNINLAGYGNSTCLDFAPHIEDMELIKFLLDNGADPNIGSDIGDGWEVLGRTVLQHVWEDEVINKDCDFTPLARLLLSYGALTVPVGEKLDENELDKWINEMKAEKHWDDSLCSGLSKLDSALINGAKFLYFYRVALIARNGGNIGVRDTHGQNLLQIVLEDAEPEKLNPQNYQNDLTEIILTLLCGLKLKLSKEEIEQAKATCRAKGYTEALEAIASVTSKGGN